MTDALAKFRERMSQDRTARDAPPSAESARAPSSATIGGASFVPGDRVFDRATGIEGDVIDVSRRNVVVPNLKPSPPAGAAGAFQLPSSATVDVVTIRLMTGVVLPRHPDELVKRPTPPRAEKGSGQ